MNRSDFLRNLGKGLLAVGLIDLLSVSDGLSRFHKAAVTHWVLRLEEMCGDLKEGEMALIDWQRETEALLERVPLEDLCRDIDFESLCRKIELPESGVGTRKFLLPRVEGMPDHDSFKSKLFGMKPGRAIIPHGHENMASSHLILSGQFHLRQYDKVRGDRDFLWMKPTVEAQVGPGEASSISDEQDNIHWLIAGKEPAFTLDIIMLDLGGKEHDIFNLDMDEGEWESGLLRCPVIGVEEALQKYGNDLHHH